MMFVSKFVEAVRQPMNRFAIDYAFLTPFVSSLLRDRRTKAPRERFAGSAACHQRALFLNRRKRSRFSATT